MRRSWILIGCGLPGLLGAQGINVEWHPWVVEAVDAGCLTRDGAEVLGAASWPGPAPQQEVVRWLGMGEGQRVLRCLLAHAPWQERLFNPRAGSQGTALTRALVRGGVVASSGLDPTFRCDARLRHKQKSWQVQGAFRTSSEDPPLWVGSLGWRGGRGRWALGSVMPKVGQGSVLWSAGAFDGLGGMEGTHRMPQGFVEAGGRWRGVLDGVAWKRESGWQESAWSVDGAVVGRWWQGEGVAAFWGRTPGPNHAVRIRLGAEGRARGAVGLHGGGEWKGWSARWGLAGFEGGWGGRGSILRSWTQGWEAHAALERLHPGHPAESSGERRASVPDAGAQPTWQAEAGVAWMGKGRGSLRWRRRHGFDPHALPSERVVGQVERGRHRVRVHLDGSPGSRGPADWGIRWRTESHPIREGQTLRIRMHLLWAARGVDRGGAWAVTARWDRAEAARWTFGVGQSWGSRSAPVRHVTGWDDRPAQAFRGREAHAFLRWRSPGGRWQGRVRWAWPSESPGSKGAVLAHSWVDVEFHPHRRRRPPS